LSLGKATVTAILSLLLAACAGAPRMDAPVNENWQRRYQILQNIQQWEFTGRIAVRDDIEAQNSRIRWRQQGDNFVINLWGALNIGATEIIGSPEQVRLQQEGQDPLITDTPEQLIRDQLGYELPVSNLEYWIKGIPAPDGEPELVFNEFNQLISLQQSGWQIEYLGYTNYQLETLPTRIRMQKPPLQLDFVRLSWTLGTTE
jgi:outer membrane lipoprotein LolB